jgi:hypothetical protein
MSLFYENLDERTRQLMLEEVEYDIAHNQLHISPFLSGQGQWDYPHLLRKAIQKGNDETLVQDLQARRRILRALPRRKPKGGYLIAATVENAAEVLAESEFNRYYIRGLARRAIEEGIPELVVQNQPATLGPSQRREWKWHSHPKNCSRIYELILEMSCQPSVSPPDQIQVSLSACLSRRTFSFTGHRLIDPVPMNGGLQT